MSRYVRGVPRDIALCLMDKYDLNVFIETGTLIGYTAEWAAKHFGHVFTVEFFDEYYELAYNRLSIFRNISCIKNNSIYALEWLRWDWDTFCSPLFWLDAHWGEEAHYGRPELESQVLSEIDSINLWQSTHAIIVDDAHKLSTPRWPARESVIAALKNNGKREVKEYYDVLVATPTEGIYYAAESIDVSAVAEIS